MAIALIEPREAQQMDNKPFRLSKAKTISEEYYSGNAEIYNPNFL